MNNDMKFGRYTAKELTENYGSPLYVYEKDIICRQAAALVDTFKNLPLDIHYACKANTNIQIMKLLGECGLKMDCVSRGEILAAQQAGFSNDHITFTGNNVTEEDMTWIHEQDILMIMDSVDQVQRFGELFSKNTKPLGCGVRLNHVGAGHHSHVITGGPDSKFGIVKEDYAVLFDVIKTHNISLKGVHQHIGSGILNADDWIVAMDILLDSLKDFPAIEWVDFGGGLGVPYAPEDVALDMQELGRRVEKRWQEFVQITPSAAKMRIHMQPGRFLLAESGTLLMTVQSLKKTENHIFAGTDSGLHHHIRHPLYKAYHPIWNATGHDRPRQVTAVTGNICESGDLFTHGREMGEVRVGDVLALGKAGAYGFSMASHYNSHLLPAEVMIDSKEAILIRRREGYNRLLTTQEGLNESH